MRGWRMVRTAALPRVSRAMRFGVLGAVVLTAAGAWTLYGSSAFEVTEVEVAGTTFTDPEAVRQAAFAEVGAALAAVDTDDVAARVEQVPSVASASVSRDWPHTLVVTVTERTPFLGVPGDGGVRLVDASGVAYRTVKKMPDGVLPAELKSPGPDDPSTVGVLSVLNALSPELYERLESVAAPAPTRIELRLHDDRVVFWGDATDNETKSEVATVLLARPEKEIDVSAPGVPTVSD